MYPIFNLYNKNHILYDYPIHGGKRLSYRINNGKPFLVYHADGNYSMAYGYGEKKYTYDKDELRMVRESDAAKHQYMAERKLLLERLNAMSNEQLKAMLEMAE